MSYDLIIQNIEEMNNCYVSAPAGCGKTQMICDIANNATKGILLLTHTNAGVDVMKKRVKNSIVKINTLSSFVNKYVKAYKKLTDLLDEEISYENQYSAFVNLLHQPIISRVISYNYFMIFVDEFQDCTLKQCEVINGLSKIIPVKVFGDEMQSIFDFENVAKFSNLEEFSFAGELNVPWRWKDNIELGKWTIAIRDDFDNSFSNVISSNIITKISQDSFFAKYSSYLKKGERNCIITKRKNQSVSICRRMYGYYVLEELELRDLKKFSDLINYNTNQRLVELLLLLKNSYTNASTFLNIYIDKISNDNYDFSRLKNTELSSFIKKMATEFSYENVCNLVKYLHQNKCRLIRYELVHYCCKLIKKYTIEKTISKESMSGFYSNIKRIDNDNVVAHTLLIKGLEYDNCVVFGNELTKNELYVAYTRAKKKLVIVV